MLVEKCNNFYTLRSRYYLYMDSLRRDGGGGGELYSMCTVAMLNLCNCYAYILTKYKGC